MDSNVLFISLGGGMVDSFAKKLLCLKLGLCAKAPLCKQVYDGLCVNAFPCKRFSV